MGRIRLLPDSVASQVAAGEVVERPASILKELVENSLDAGAQRIEVEWAHGGSRLLRVVDDGIGMTREDALLSLERHATSKIRTGADLARIVTFGFRGEALPSIASVSRFRMITRCRESDDAATEILVEGGKVHEVRECGAAPGTQIEVRDLFFNVPARRKFLRTEITESGHLLHTFHTIALAHPSVGFALRKDGRLIHQLAASDSLTVRVRDLFGDEWLEQLIAPEPVEHRGVRVSGMVSRPGFLRLDRSGQFFFLNRRPVSDAAIARGLRAAGVETGGRSGTGYTSAILFLEMDPSRFDCNVHPAKREVRFQRPDEVSEAVEAFLRKALAQQTQPVPPSFSPRATAPGRTAPPQCLPENPPIPESLQTHTPHEELPGIAQPEPSQGHEMSHQLPPAAAPEIRIIARHEQRLRPVEPGQEPASQADSPAAAPFASKPNVPNFRYLGNLGGRYLLWESSEGLVTMEIRNALERIFYEEAARMRGRVAAQRLLPPLVFRLDARDAAWAVENANTLAEFGIHLEGFGPGAIKLDALPAGLDDWSPEEVLLRLLDDLRAGSRAAANRFLQDGLALSLAAIKAARYKPAFGEEIPLLRRLFSCELPYVSPSGRHVLLQTGWRELERKFTPGPGTGL